MLRAYPKSVVRKLGHALIFMILDATECFAETASMKTVNAILYSNYKHNSTMKWLVGCDPIDIVWGHLYLLDMARDISGKHCVEKEFLVILESSTALRPKQLVNPMLAKVYYKYVLHIYIYIAKNGTI